MHWTEAIQSRPHCRIMHYLMDDEHDEFGPPTLEHIAAEMRLDLDSTLNLLRPLIESGIVVSEPAPFGGAMFSMGEVLGTVS